MNKWALAVLRLTFVAVMIYGVYGNTNPYFRTIL
jgi:hypothetical protein